MKLDENVVYMDSADLWAFIASMDPDEVANDDYVDSETGEVALSVGQRARESELHPQHRLDKSAKLSRNDDGSDLDDDELFTMLHGDDEDDAVSSQRMAQFEYETAVAEYAAGVEGQAAAVFDEDDVQSVAADLADAFFSTHPKWKQWAAALDLSKEDIRSFVADSTYEALMT